MKNVFTLLLLIGINNSLFAQTGTQPVDNRREIWNSVVKAIIDFDESNIYQLTHFPLEGDWYLPEGQSNEELKALYKSELNYFYPQEMRDYLKKKDFTILVAYPNKGTAAFAFTYYDELMETTTIVHFAEITGQWKLVALTIK